MIVLNSFLDWVNFLYPGICFLIGYSFALWHIKRGKIKINPHKEPPTLG